jgi:hypothetical protein
MSKFKHFKFRMDVEEAQVLERSRVETLVPHPFRTTVVIHESALRKAAQN